MPDLPKRTASQRRRTYRPAYRDVHCTAPIRVDHVPTMAGEANNRPRYETVGRLYAIGYLRGLMDASGYDLL